MISILNDKRIGLIPILGLLILRQLNTPIIVIPAKAGIQKNTGCPRLKTCRGRLIKSGMTALVSLIAMLMIAGLFNLTADSGAMEFISVDAAPHKLLEVKVHRLIIDPTNNTPVVLLADPDKEHALYIGIGINEARAIYSEMKKIKFHRPLTHDLLERIIRKSEGNVRHIVIPRLKDNTYYATIVMAVGTSVVEIDARPSDSIVLALKFKVPIYVSKRLFKDMALPLENRQDINEQYGVILQELTPSIAQYLSYDSTSGVLVSEIRKGSLADKDGIAVGDIFVDIDGQTIADVISMIDALNQSKTPLTARIFRKDRYLTIILHLE